MALRFATSTALQRRAFLLGAPAALMLLAASTAYSASKRSTLTSRALLPRDCGFIVDTADARIDLGVLPPA